MSDAPPTRSEVDAAWLDYAWRVANWPRLHAGPCIAAGGAPQTAAPEGRHNDLRWPGYLGRKYVAGQGVLCLAAAGRQPPRYENTDHAAQYEQMGGTLRRWIENGRSAESDARFMEDNRELYERALPTWDRWRNIFRTFVETHLGIDRQAIAYGNLAKCRAVDGANTEELSRVCQSAFPVHELLEAIRPAAVIVAGLNARPGGGVVRRWRSTDVDPIVWTFQGRNGKGCDGRRFSEWGPDIAAQIRDRIAASG
jgi:hypothetical protein